jgi:hypothetical protein
MNHIGVNGREMVHFINFGGTIHTNIGQKYSHICKALFYLHGLKNQYKPGPDRLSMEIKLEITG